MSRYPRMLDDSSGLVELTSRVQHGRFLMRPSAEVNDIILGVLGRAQRKYDVTLHAFIFMSNHKHILATVGDEERMALFECYLKANIAKELGRLHDWRETFWGRRYHSGSLRLTDEDQARRFLYILENGCKEGLVASPLEWPGVSSAGALYRGETTMKGTWYDRTAQYRSLLRGKYELHATTETVTLTPLPFLQERSADEQRAFVVDAVHDIEEKTALMHKENGTRPMGVRAIRRQKPHDKPKNFTPTPAPLFHAVNRDDFREMYDARQAKVALYRDAAKRLRDGETDVEFPEGCFPPRLPFVKPRAPT